MYKIVFLPTGHVFELPDETAQELKTKFPNDYKIIEKNGKKYRERKQQTAKLQDASSIYSKVTEG